MRPTRPCSGDLAQESPHRPIDRRCRCFSAAVSSSSSSGGCAPSVPRRVPRHRAVASTELGSPVCSAPLHPSMIPAGRSCSSTAPTLARSRIRSRTRRPHGRRARHRRRSARRRARARAPHRRMVSRVGVVPWSARRSRLSAGSDPSTGAAASIVADGDELRPAGLCACAHRFGVPGHGGAVGARARARAAVEVALRRDRLAIDHGRVWRLATALVVQDGGVEGTVFTLAGLAVVGLLAERLLSRRDWVIAT